MAEFCQTFKEEVNRSEKPLCGEYLPHSRRPPFPCQNLTAIRKLKMYGVKILHKY